MLREAIAKGETPEGRRELREQRERMEAEALQDRPEGRSGGSRDLGDRRGVNRGQGQGSSSLALRQGIKPPSQRVENPSHFEGFSPYKG